MINMIIKYPEQGPEIKEIDSMQTVEALMEGEFEITQDDLLPGIFIIVNEEVRGIKPHNFTVQSEGTHDWVYGTSLFMAMEADKIISLTDQQISEIKDYFARTRAYK